MPSNLFNQRLISLSFLLLVVAFAARPITDPDFWWHLKTGQVILETKSIPHSDIYSSTKLGSEWITHEWFSEVFMYLVFAAAGFGGLITLFALIVGLSFWIAFKTCLARKAIPIIAALPGLLGAAATTPVWGVRPQMFSLLFASCFLWILDRYCRNRASRAIWLLVPLMVLWVNMHAGFAVGLVLILLTAAGLVLDKHLVAKLGLKDIWESVRNLVIVELVALASVCVNPNGVRLYSYPFETLRSVSMMKYIEEWHSPNFQDPTFLSLLVFFLVALLILALSRQQARPSDLLMLLATAAATLRSARNVPFFALVAIPIIAEHLTVLAQTFRRDLFVSHDKNAADNRFTSGFAVGILLLVILPAALVYRVWDASTRQTQAFAKDFPGPAVDFIEARQLPQPIYNEYHWGGYLIWRLYPQYRVYIDGRADVYGDALVDEFFVVHDGQIGWRQPLQSYGVRTVVVAPDSAIASLLREDDAWKKMFEDRQAVVFVR